MQTSGETGGREGEVILAQGGGVVLSGRPRTFMTVLIRFPPDGCWLWDCDVTAFRLRESGHYGKPRPAVKRMATFIAEAFRFPHWAVGCLGGPRLVQDRPRGRLMSGFVRRFRSGRA